MPNNSPTLPCTSTEHYLTGLTALNTHVPEGTGDWHFSETFEGFAGRQPGPFQLAGKNTLDTHVWLGDAGIFDARPRLDPYHLNFPPGPIYAADHYRAIADIVLAGVSSGSPFEQAINLDDWLPQSNEKRRLIRMLEKARPILSQ